MVGFKSARAFANTAFVGALILAAGTACSIAEITLESAISLAIWTVLHVGQASGSSGWKE